MKKQIIATFEYQDEQNGPIKTYSKPIKFPEKPPMAFHAIHQFSTHVHWVEKNALRARIEELEKALDRCLEDMLTHGGTIGVISQAKKALAKARGEK
jgi:hypothetical protein